MKKIYWIALWLLVISVAFSSCNTAEYTQTEETSVQVTTEASSETEYTDSVSVSEETSVVTENTTVFVIEPIDHGFDRIASYPTTNSMTESGRFVLFDYRGTICCYDKKSGKADQFCFDTYCSHTNWQECISLRFLMMDSNQSVVYSEYDHRFYALRGEKLCSFSHEGEDISIVYAFGESGDFDEFLYDIWSVYDLQVYHEYLYMIVCDADTGKKDLFRYDMSTGEMRKLSEALAGDIEKYFIYGDKIHYRYLQKGKACYHSASLDMTGIREHFEIRNVDPFYDQIVRDGRCYTKTKMNSKTMLCYMDLESGRITTVGSIAAEGELLAVTDAYVYYAVQTKYPMYTELYAVHIRTGYTTLVLHGEKDFSERNWYSGPKFRLENLCFLADGKVLFTGMTGSISALYMAEIGKDGHFQNIERIWR
jgi:hypothetical protein